MEKEKLEGLLIDFIDGRLNEAERNEVGKILHSDAGAKVLFEQLKHVTRAIDQSADIEPGARMRSRFQQMLTEEERFLPARLREALLRSKAGRHGAKASRQVFFHPAVTRVAAALVLLMVGISIGYWVNNNQRQQDELRALREEMEATKQMVMAMLDNQQSASQRIKGVNVVLSLEKTDDEVVRVLVKMMNEDLNTNVRLAALEALSNLHQEPEVRKALIQSLSIQKDPVIQIALIQLMVKVKEKSVVRDLNRIIDDVHTIKAVKDEAYTGLLRLS